MPAEQLERLMNEYGDAVFVADGICYSLKGRFSIDIMKNIVNAME